jgi:hypothetical protein
MLQCQGAQIGLERTDFSLPSLSLTNECSLIVNGENIRHGHMKIISTGGNKNVNKGERDPYNGEGI